MSLQTLLGFVKIITAYCCTVNLRRVILDFSSSLACIQNFSHLQNFFRSSCFFQSALQLDRQKLTNWHRKTHKKKRLLRNGWTGNSAGSFYDIKHPRWSRTSSHLRICSAAVRHLSLRYQQSPKIKPAITVLLSPFVAKVVLRTDVSLTYTTTATSATLSARLRCACAPFCPFRQKQLISEERITARWQSRYKKPEFFRKSKLTCKYSAFLEAAFIYFTVHKECFSNFYFVLRL